MKKGLPNILPLPNSCPKPWQDFWQCQCSFALRFGKHMQVAYTWTVVFEFVWLLTQDGAGGFNFAGNAFKVIGAATDIDELKKVRFASWFLRFFSFESVMAINQQSFLVSNMCDEFMVCGCMRVWSINLLNRAVCSEESRVMFIEGVPPLPCRIVCVVRRLRKKSQTKSFAIQMRSIYTAGRRAL